jgi:hypothetical protein
VNVYCREGCERELQGLRTSGTANRKKLGEWNALIAQKDKELEILRNKATQRQSTDILNSKGEILDHLKYTDERLEKLLTKEAKILELTDQATRQANANASLYVQAKSMGAREDNVDAK